MGCGNKGYSHDYFSNNKGVARKKRKKGTKKMQYTNDTDHKRQKPQLIHMHNHYTRETMKKIHFHDYDYIANEVGAQFWNNALRDWYRSLELHIPCRDPVDLFLSMCN